MSCSFVAPRRAPASCVVTVLVAIAVAAVIGDGRPARAADAERIGRIREEARLLRAELAGDAWEAATVRRPDRRAKLLGAHRELLSPGTLTALRAARLAAAPADAGLLERLELDIARWTILAGVAPLDREIAERLASVTADVEDYPRPLTLAQIDGWIGQDTDSLRVRMLESARLGLWRDRIDPLLERRRAAVDSLVAALGYLGYTEFAMRLRRADPEPVLAGLFGVIRATDTMYQILGRELVSPRPGGLPRPAVRTAAVRLTAADLKRLAWSDAWDRYVDPAPELAAAWVAAPAAVDPARPLPKVTTLKPLVPFEGRTPVVDDAADVRAVVVAPDSPAEVLLAVPELSGMAAARAALTAAGEARQRNGTAESSPEWRDGGPELLPLTAAELSAALVASPEWYETRRREERAAGKDTDVTRLSDVNLARLVRWHLWNDLRRIRTELAAGLVVDLVRHRAGTDYWMPYVFAPVGADERDLVRQVRGFALGVEMTPAEAYDALASPGDFLPALDAARAVALAAQVEERLRERIGPEWFIDGDLRREAVFATPDGLAAAPEADIARALAGADAIDFGAYQRRCERLFEWSEQVLETAR